MALAATTALVLGACDGAVEVDDGGPGDACDVDADCIVVNDCCEGCFAANTGYAPSEPCGADCDQSACDSKFGAGAEVIAVCDDGSCDLVVDAPVDPVCEDDTDCQIIGDCCLGCVALHVDESVPPCDSPCFADPCMPTGTGAPPQAFCNQGACEIVDDSCEAAADCKVVSDCCLGCVAMPVDAEVPDCQSACEEDPCIAQYGEDAILTATCGAEATCGIAVAQPT